MSDSTSSSDPTPDPQPTPTTPVATTAADFQASPSLADAKPTDRDATQASGATTTTAVEPESNPPIPNPTTAEVATIGERVLFGLRQAGLIAVALVIAGLVTERLRPTDVIDRGIASTPFLWAVVLWIAVLLFHAIAFERSQMSALERGPLFAALAVAVVVLVSGLISLDTVSTGRRLIYLLGNALGSVMFWWALFSLAALIIRRIADEPASA